ncbi:MAG: F0F1 ATP synthase subunit alpha [Candidatus Omnitrophica bacterium]|nr:F0F1 ATP synthase subunit alpha [Candidatus Omnitrophota bacterium]
MSELRYTEVGYVKSIRGCIVIVEGLHNCINGQLVEFGLGTFGIIVGFNEKEAHVLIVKETISIRTGDEVRASLEPFTVPVGENFIGRIVNPLCEPFDGLGPIKEDDYYPIFPSAPPILNRQPLHKTLETGLKVIDAMIPIGLGQRELILGNKMTGKTTVITDIILNQKHTDVICIYVATGKARSQLARAVNLFVQNNAFEYTIVVAAPSSSPAGQQYLSIYVACSLGEYFMQRGKDVFIGFDDFTKHAWCYREISLLLGRPPGRDSYPGDVFYLHSKMIERACHFDEERGSGTMTFLPIVEILEGDLTAFVPSNLVSMTDGQIFLDAQMFGEGQRPALDLGLSVSRVGTKVQWPIIKDLSGPLRLEYLQFRELKRSSALRAGSQNEETMERLRSGEILTQLLRQDKDKPVQMEALVLILFAFREKYFMKLEMEQIIKFQDEIFNFAKDKNPDLIKTLRERKKMDDEIQQSLTDVIQEFIKTELGEVHEEEPEEDSGDIISNIGRDVLEEATSKKDKTNDKSSS